MDLSKKKISFWRIAIVFGAMFLFVLGIPSLPGTHRLIYWAIALVVEITLCAILLPSSRQNSN